MAWRIDRLSLFSFLFLWIPLLALTNGKEKKRGELFLTASQAELIGKKIWENESGGKVSGLLAWNVGEDFASLGICHFIWYPAGKKGPFEESFPRFLEFALENGAKLPRWLTPQSNCPWSTRAIFYAAEGGRQMEELKLFLLDTIPLQIQFAILKLKNALPKMLALSPANEKKKVEENFILLSQSPRGVYALIDYVNFKGDGTWPTERYKGKGWGLLQVLEEMDGGDPVDAFCQAAENVLKRRVKNAPPSRHEERWLAGWINRIETYRH
ncbi:hypothetical protein A946_02375 [Methylacidiphilum kamchatkense Kam1]|uniref:Uncharacterized protein n=1 Tax=Methylacidiphilum kamchatkense Kam1 TaxID=1202785 RepID=A0A0C1UT00_9BACT|nr:hypothetical protein [Methylacidiphilum kamchatkense]KIE58928.1 hypothetical protein A946_02375 [Methylacidiphilum kamchatkense Kam1]QDQ43193.1 hypothetical protein kam1_1983 [Methylacidiphilum kamchatkense Kam1]